MSTVIVGLTMISNESDLRNLIDRIETGSDFSDAFKFVSIHLFNKFLESIGIQIQEFANKPFYRSIDEKLVISKSSNDYVLISTMGLVSHRKMSDNSFVNAFDMQSIVLSLLIDEASRLLDQEDVYDIDSSNYRQFCSLTPAFIHNLFFFYETLAKAYLALNNRSIPRKHSLVLLFQRMKETMIELDHTDTRFHAFIIPWLDRAVKYIESVPGDFREQYIKYDANPSVTTVLRVSHSSLNELRYMLSLARRLILFYPCTANHWYILEKGYYKMLLDCAETDDEKEKVMKRYGFLITS